MSASEEIRDLFVKALEEIPDDHPVYHLQFALISSCLRVLATHIDEIEYKMSLSDRTAGFK